MILHFLPRTWFAKRRACGLPRSGRALKQQHPGGRGDASSLPCCRLGCLEITAVKTRCAAGYRRGAKVHPVIAWESRQAWLPFVSLEGVSRAARAAHHSMRLCGCSDLYYQSNSIYPAPTARRRLLHQLRIRPGPAAVLQGLRFARRSSGAQRSCLLEKRHRTDR